MSGFRAVNTTTLTVLDAPARRPGEETTPTTPRPNKYFSPDQPQAEIRADDPTAKTPTRDSFVGLAGQLPLPSSPFTPSQEGNPTPSRAGVLSRGGSHRSTQSSDSQDVEMEDDDPQDGSDNESVNSDSNRPSKKKKGQRFFCTEFPPCQLSFTRSEHLARHIRKHTGERPFQCHCSRRFSRLDNLRQHAQTVHVNEDIPGDSLAATGTRFQRQIRTDRVRPPNNRPRASTISSQDSHSRGHSRNLSASSITSTGSNLSQRDDFRRRPAPLAMASDGAARARLTLDTFTPPNVGSPGGQYTGYGNQSPGGISTPTSSIVSGTGSPRFSSGLQSPISTGARPYSWGGRTPGRRLSVPSGANPFQAPPGHLTYPTPYITPLQSSTNSTFSGNSSLFASPTSSVFSDGRRDSLSAAEAEWRRRTWHPGTYSSLTARPATSGLSYFQVPDTVQPASAAQSAASPVTRLPGIESFDHAPPQPAFSRRQPSPMQVDAPDGPSGAPDARNHTTVGPDDRRGHVSWDAALHKGLTKLDIANATPPRESQRWHQYPTPQEPASASRPTTAPHPSYFPAQNASTPPQTASGPAAESSHISAERLATSRKNKRHGWYNGPLPLTQQSVQPSYVARRISPEDSSSSDGVPTPSTSSLGEYHPAIVHSNGYIESHPPGVALEEHHKLGSNQAPQHAIDRGQISYASGAHNGSGQSASSGRELPRSYGDPNDTRRLEALVAVAAREERVINAGT